MTQPNAEAEEAVPYQRPTIWQLAAPSIMANLMFSMVAMVQTKFVGSMGALQCYVEGSIAELPIGFESAYETMALVEAAYRSSARQAEPLPL